MVSVHTEKGEPMSEYKYKSPIEIIQGEMEMRFEGEVMKAVQNVGINVNKDELLKALAYDRDQYNKGYHDAEPKVGKWIRITQGLVVEKYACSVCGRVIEDGESEALLFIKYPYCHCGAKMERRSDEYTD